MASAPRVRGPLSWRSILVSGRTPVKATGQAIAAFAADDAASNGWASARAAPARHCRDSPRSGRAGLESARASEDAPCPTPPPRTVPELFLDRVGRTPDAEAFRYPAGAAGGASPGPRRRRACAPSPRGSARSASSASRSAPSSPPPGSSGCWRTTGSSAPAAPPAPSTRRPRRRSARSSSPTRARWSPSPRTPSRSRSSRSRRAELPALRHVVTFDGGAAPDGWVITLAELEARGRAWDARAPGRLRGARRRGPPRRARDAHLHLRHHRPAEGRRADARLLGVAVARRCRRPGSSTTRTCSSSSGCRSRTRSGR